MSGPHGPVVLNANGSFTYTPNANYYGVDSFVYRVCDPSMLCDTATVTITLAGTPDDPIAVDDPDVNTCHLHTQRGDASLVVVSPRLPPSMIGILTTYFPRCMPGCRPT